MTPEQRNDDIKLAASMRTQAQRVERRSRKIALVLRQGADRIDALSVSMPIVQPQPPGLHEFADGTHEIQPASNTGPQAQPLEPVRD